MLTDVCPVCNEKGLLYHQSAEIRYEIVGGQRLVPILDVNDIGWFDSTSLYCPNCYANSDDNKELQELHHEYDNHV
jgi:uncharacterized protein YbaR (Trm112 family)